MTGSTRVAILLCLVALLGPSRGMAQGTSAVPAGVSPAAIAQGDKVYHGTGLCFACHGANAKGAVGPDLTDTTWIHSKGTYPEIVAQVTKGVTKEESKTGVPMPPKGGSTISDDDLKAVSAYVWSLSHGAAASK